MPPFDRRSIHQGNKQTPFKAITTARICLLLVFSLSQPRFPHQNAFQEDTPTTCPGTFTTHRERCNAKERTTCCSRPARYLTTNSNLSGIALIAAEGTTNLKIDIYCIGRLEALKRPSLMLTESLICKRDIYHTWNTGRLLALKRNTNAAIWQMAAIPVLQLLYKDDKVYFKSILH